MCILKNCPLWLKHHKWNLNWLNKYNNNLPRHIRGGLLDPNNYSLTCRCKQNPINRSPVRLTPVSYLLHRAVVIKVSLGFYNSPTLAVSFTYLIMPDYYYYLRSIEYWREVKVLTSYVELMVSLTSIEYWREVKVLNSYVELIVSLTLLGYLYKKIPAKNLPCGVSRPKFYMWSLVYCVEIYGWNCFGKPLKKCVNFI